MKYALMLSLGLAWTSALAEGPAPAPMEKTDKAKEEKFALLDADALQKLQAKGPVHIYDVNGDDLRTKDGIIPGAQLLSSFNTFDAKELPTDKAAQLVFYCANTH